MVLNSNEDKEKSSDIVDRQNLKVKVLIMMFVFV